MRARLYYKLFFSFNLLMFLCLVSKSGFSQEERLKNQRCATRLSISLLGESPSSELYNSANPQSATDSMLKDDLFNRRFSRFLNAAFNEEPGANRLQDAPYFIAYHVLSNNEPYKNIFIGPYNLSRSEESNEIVVSIDPDGLGYFRIGAWMDRYAGNESEGYRLITAYQMLNNVLGTKMVATTNAPNADTSAEGRKSPACSACHYDSWFALDHIASVLSRVERDADMNISYVPVDDSLKPVLGGFMVKNDKELIQAMVDSQDFAFNACRLSFKFLYGRKENKGEASIFDQCMTSFKSSGLIQDALAVIAKDKAFCE